MTIRSIKKVFLLATVGPVLMMSFLNCSGFTSESSSRATVPESMRIQSSAKNQNYTLQTADQMARSMASVTGVEYVNNIVNEFNGRKTLMSTDYSLNSVTAPMLISITNLASRYCEEMIRVEALAVRDQRKIFGAVDFTKSVSNLLPEDFDLTLNRMSQQFWGRTLSSEEKMIMNDAKTEFIQAIPSGSTGSATQTRNLMLSTCSGMLSAIEFITI